MSVLFLVAFILLWQSQVLLEKEKIYGYLLLQSVLTNASQCVIMGTNISSCEVVMKETNKIRPLCSVTFVLYLLVLFWAIALKCNMQDAVLDAKMYNQDFTLAERFQRHVLTFSKTYFEDAVLNVLVFIPFGMAMPFMISKRVYISTAFYCCLISIGFELLQLFNCIGRFTYIDIIHNTAGGIIGLLIYFLFHRIVREKPLKIAFIILICILVPMVIAATANTIIHIDYYL